MEIPWIKLNPKDILPILEIVKKNENNYTLMKKKIHEYLLEESPTGSISFRNAVYALSFHTLRVLKLIKGKGTNLRLSTDGEILLKTYEKDNFEGYCKELAKIVARADQEDVGVLETIEKLNKDVFDTEDVTRELNKESRIPLRNDRLTKWIRLLKFVRFVDEVDGNKYKYNKYQVSALNRKLQGMSLKDFFDVLNSEYQELTKKRRGNPYIPIPEIEDAVCNRLIDKGFMTFDFRKYLKQLNNNKVRGYTTYFSKPGARESGGLRIDSTYYYYIAIFGDRDGI
jgi:hypothetical protein